MVARQNFNMIALRVIVFQGLTMALMQHAKHLYLPGTCLKTTRGLFSLLHGFLVATLGLCPMRAKKVSEERNDRAGAPIKSGLKPTE